MRKAVGGKVLVFLVMVMACALGAASQTTAPLARGSDGKTNDEPNRGNLIWANDFRERIPNEWVFKQSKGPGTDESRKGMCITSHHRGEDDGNWASPYGFVNLAADSVIEVRATVSTNNRKAFATPTWMLVYDNISASGQEGQNEYGGEVFFLDNEGGANSPIPGVGRSEFTAFLMPIAMQAPQFASAKSGFFSPPLDWRNDMRVMFRVLSLPAYESAKVMDPATVCLDKLEIYRHSLKDMVVDEVVYSVDRFADANSTATTNAWALEVSGQEATATFNADGSVTIAPAKDWNDGTNVMFRPGDTVTNLSGVGDTACNNDNWPIPWVANATYYIEFTASAPSEAAELDAPDVIRVGADTLTSELVCDHFAVPNTPDLSGGRFNEKSPRGLSTPRLGEPQKYACFFHTGSVTKSRIPGAARWRPRFDILTSHDLNPVGRATNTAGITVHSVMVKKVHFGK
ncbi:hypothetical protein LLG95_18175 [bacterium]|nr:hypothetical protein [bacterium]